MIFENAFKLHSPIGSWIFERLFKYHPQWKYLVALAFIRLPLLININNINFLLEIALFNLTSRKTFSLIKINSTS